MSTWADAVHRTSWMPSVAIPPGCAEQTWVATFDALFPKAVASLQATAQDPVHHAEGDVWTHTKMVVNCLLNHPTYAAASAVEQYILWMAAVLHDISKPTTTQVLPDGRVVAPGHARQGAVWARGALWQENCPLDVREMVCRLITYHQTPFFAFSSRREESAEFLARKISLDCNISLLTALAESDMRGRVCADQQKVLDDIALFAEVAHELDCWAQAYAFPDRATSSRYILAHGTRDADTSVYLDNPFDVVLLSGLPASGKDTWCAEHAQGQVVVSYDDMRQQLGLAHGEKTGTVVHAVHDQARVLLRQRQPFVWNATHLSENMRAPALSLIRQYGGAPKIVCLEAPMDALLARNSTRNSSLPNAQLLRMIGKWEYPWSWEADDVRQGVVLGAKAGRKTSP